VNYPDGTSVYAGYNDAGEQSWGYRPTSGYTVLHRDSLHRVHQVEVMGEV
jgi:hypothetical protein